MTKTPTIADRVEALEALLTRKGIVTSEQLDSIVARYADQVGPLNGARLIARAWTDPEFKARLLTMPLPSCMSGNLRAGKWTA